MNMRNGRRPNRSEHTILGHSRALNNELRKLWRKQLRAHILVPFKDFSVRLKFTEDGAPERQQQQLLLLLLHGLSLYTQ